VNATVPGVSAYMTGGGNGGTGIQAQGSRIVLVASTVTGGAGNSMTSGPAPGAGGSAVVLAANAALDVYGASTLTGGNGGTDAQAPQGRPGGHGLVVQNGSRARMLGGRASGGAGGYLQPNGLPILVDATSAAAYDPTAQTPQARLVGQVLPLATVTFTLNAAPGTPAVLLADLASAFTQTAELSLGALAVPLPASAVIGGLTVPASGVLGIPAVVPSGWPAGSFLIAQFITYDAGRNALECSNGFAAVAR